MQHTIEYKNVQDVAEHLSQLRDKLVRKTLILLGVGVVLFGLSLGLVFEMFRPFSGIVEIGLVVGLLLLVVCIRTCKECSRELVCMSTEVLEGDDCTEMMAWMEEHPHVAAYIAMVNEERAVTQYDKTLVQRWIAAQAVQH